MVCAAGSRRVHLQRCGRHRARLVRRRGELTKSVAGVSLVCEDGEMAVGSHEARGWLLDEMASIGRENLDAVHVSRYDDKEDADAASEVRLLQALGLHRV